MSTPPTKVNKKQVPDLVEGVESRLGCDQGRLCLFEILLAVFLFDGHLFVDPVHRQLLLVGDSLLLRNLLSLNTDNLNQLVGLLILLRQLNFLNVKKT